MVSSVIPPLSPVEPGKIAGPGSLLHAARSTAGTEVSQQRATAAQSGLTASQRTAVSARATQVRQTARADATAVGTAAQSGDSATTIKSVAAPRAAAQASKVAQDITDLHGAETRAEGTESAASAAPRGGSVNRSA